jgi:hypothetical protein
MRVGLRSMRISRRKFVATASCAGAAGLCSLPSFARGSELLVAASDAGARTGAVCTLLDLEANCALPESHVGMRAALGDGHRHATEIGLSNIGAVVVVPAAGTVRAETFRAVVDSLDRGATVLWESGAAFLDPRDFEYQQNLVREYFGISMERPIDVWSQSDSRRARVGAKNQSARNTRAIGHERIPYVVYRWPREAHVRDFSRVIPVTAGDGKAIAHWGEISVAWRKTVGAGTLIFLGSPIGPALRASDSEAQSLLRSMINV